MIYFSWFVLLTAWACTILAATPVQWKSQSIYFVLTDRFARTDGSTTEPCALRQYCGGTWKGLIDKLDYIIDMGFTAVWITPITHNIEEETVWGKGYHGYWQDDLYTLNQHYGSEDDLKALAQALHERGMYLMVDVVANHFAFSGSPDAVRYESFNPFNHSKYFHPPCKTESWDNQTQVEDCGFGFDSGVELPDLDTRRADVKSLFYSWIRGLVQKYSIDGLRVDTTKHVQQDFWPDFKNASGVYNIGEVSTGSPAYLCEYQQYMDGLLNYPLYYPLKRAFNCSSGSMTDLLRYMNDIQSSCKDTALLGTFLENHDNPRFASITSDITLAANAIAFTFLADGIPVLYYGQEQHFSGGNDPNNREALWLSQYKTDSASAPLYGFIAKINQIRNTAIARNPSYVDSKAIAIYSDAHTIAMRKGIVGGQVVSVYSNKGSSGDAYSLSLSGTGYVIGSEVVEIMTCQRQRILKKGIVKVEMNKGETRIFYPTAGLLGSGICGC